MTFHPTSYHLPGRLTPPEASGLRARTVRLGRREVMDWHSTQAREELLIALRGRVRVDIRRSGRRLYRVLASGRCLFLPSRTTHRVVNLSATDAMYLYVTAPAR